MIQLACDGRRVLLCHRELGALPSFSAKATLEEVELGGVLVAHQVAKLIIQPKNLPLWESCQVGEDCRCEIRMMADPGDGMEG